MCCSSTDIHLREHKKNKQAEQEKKHGGQGLPKDVSAPKGNGASDGKKKRRRKALPMTICGNLMKIYFISHTFSFLSLGDMQTCFFLSPFFFFFSCSIQESPGKRTGLHIHQQNICFGFYFFIYFYCFIVFL
ncbi:hypothetical protein BSKO_02523 [Bryopsis sp. KO-2023]|nr:hypothetical protein BSKO_02523 [Bryopsis sp. KO-2023]